MTPEEKLPILRGLIQNRFATYLHIYKDITVDDLVSECYLRGGFNAEQWQIACIRDVLDYFKTKKLVCPIDFKEKSYSEEHWIRDFLFVHLKHFNSRDVLIYLDYVFGGMKQEELSVKFKLGKSTICMTIKKINEYLKDKYVSTY